MTATSSRGETAETKARQAAMAICAEARAGELHAALEALAPLPAVRNLRPVQSGLAMLRGRMGGDGASFNLGEASVTRAAVAIEGGATGFAYHLGRDAHRARDAALLDALWQEPGRRVAVEAALAPIATRIEAERSLAERRAAATRVDFFTLARGD